MNKKIGFIGIFLLTILGITGISKTTRVEAAINEQGMNNWYFLYGEASGTYYEMEWNIERQRWEYISEEYASLTDTSSHPGNNGDVIRAWRAPYDCTVNIDYNLNHGADAGDGIIAKFGYRTINQDGTYGEYTKLRDDVCLFTEMRTIKIENVNLKRGDAIFVSINKNQTDANDSCDLNPTVNYTKTADGIEYGSGVGASRTINSIGYYSDKQGDNNWFYAFGELDRYVLMTYGNCNDGTRAWHGNYPYQQISGDTMHPADRWKTIRLFVCDYKGTINIDGYVRHQQIYGDGIRVGICKNETSIYDITIEGTDDQKHYLPNLTNISVEIGDVIALWIDSGKSCNNSSDGTTFGLEVYYKNTVGERTTNPLESYLKAVKYEGDVVNPIQVEEDLTNISKVEETKKGCNGSITTSIISMICLLTLIAFIILKKNKKYKAFGLVALMVLALSNTNSGVKLDASETYDNILDYANKQNYHQWSYYCGDAESEMLPMVYNHFDGKYISAYGVGAIQKDHWLPDASAEIMAKFTFDNDGTYKIKIEIELIALQEVGSDGVAFYVTADNSESYFCSYTLRNEVIKANEEFEYNAKKDEAMYFILSGIMSEQNDRTYVHIQITK